MRLPSVFAAVTAALLAATALASATDDATVPPAQRARVLLAQMNQTEKYTLLGGSLGAYVVRTLLRRRSPSVRVDDMSMHAAGQHASHSPSGNPCVDAERRPTRFPWRRRHIHVLAVWFDDGSHLEPEHYGRMGHGDGRGVRRKG